MLVLQIFTAALTISFAKANPVVVDVRNRGAPTTDGNIKRVGSWLLRVPPATTPNTSPLLPRPP